MLNLDFVRCVRSLGGPPSAVPQAVVLKGFNLGKWVSVQRRRYRDGKMPTSQIDLLEKCQGWMWDASALSASGQSKVGLNPKKTKKLGRG